MLDIICTVLWDICAVVWILRYRKSNKDNKIKKTLIFILPLIIGLLIGSVVYFLIDVCWVKLIVSISIIILSVVIILMNIFRI